MIIQTCPQNNLYVFSVPEGLCAVVYREFTAVGVYIPFISVSVRVPSLDHVARIITLKPYIYKVNQKYEMNRQHVHHMFLQLCMKTLA